MDSPVLRIWKTVVKAGPAKAAVTDAATGTVWTRSALAAAAARFAEAYTASVPRPHGRKVVLSVANGGPRFEVFLGLAMAGAVPVPIDPAEPEAAAVAAAEALGATHLWRDGRLSALGSQRRNAAARTRAFLVKLTSGSSGSPRGLEATAARWWPTGARSAPPWESGRATQTWPRFLSALLRSGQPGHAAPPPGNAACLASSPLPHGIATTHPPQAPAAREPCHP